MMVLNMIMIMNCSQEDALHQEQKTRHQVMVMHHGTMESRPHVQKSLKPLKQFGRTIN